jgi:hypothetical protein
MTSFVGLPFKMQPWLHVDWLKVFQSIAVRGLNLLLSHSLIDAAGFAFGIFSIAIGERTIAF